jgi:ATP-binding cassette, subfamily B, bacterial PglK
MPRYGVEALGIGIIAALALMMSFRTGGIAEALPLLGALALGAQKLLPLFQRIYQARTQVLGNRGNLEDVDTFLKATMPEGVGLRGEPDLLPFEQTLTLEGVGFRYLEGAPWIFRDVNLTIPKGSRVGFVGETGCGKSTLLDLIMGLLEPVEGALKVDGIDLSRRNLRDWQARIAHVPQTIFLADTSLEANIAFGVPPAQVERERVRIAAQRARIDAFIRALPEGYDTPVGERGVRISGGQRQRVGIARALYREADVLVLDEATSALDGETEWSVMEGIDELGDSVTVLIVAHRLSTLEACDMVFRLGDRGLEKDPFGFRATASI